MTGQEKAALPACERCNGIGEIEGPERGACPCFACNGTGKADNLPTAEPAPYEVTKLPDGFLLTNAQDSSDNGVYTRDKTYPEIEDHIVALETKLKQLKNKRDGVPQGWTATEGEWERQHGELFTLCVCTIGEPYACVEEFTLPNTGDLAQDAKAIEQELARRCRAILAVLEGGSEGEA